MTWARITQLAGNYMSHEMIKLHTDLPDFPYGRISLLYTMLNHHPAAAVHKELYSVVTSLVQLGLDTHESVGNNASVPKGEFRAMRSQQLKVLAGDYFSSRFYQLLSQAGQLDLVRLLSEAVSEINQTKMIFYTKMKQMKLTAEEYLHMGTSMKSGLFLSFTSCMNSVYERIWPEMVDRFSRCEVLLEELHKVKESTSLLGSWGVWFIAQEGSEDDRLRLAGNHEDESLLKSLFNKYEVTSKLSGLLRHSVGQLQALIQRLQSDKLQRELHTLIEPFLQASSSQPATALKELG
ncbi:MAG: heptaprenyl diphosphate synthase component 1 [Candidatus Cohnella colombiensis]|uniref:Heptaprenyl diphosphate synthase component 1 n=1 Tax=Candidatus Cohnella colombiensis TaxID=3121368 RepID=A0AA95JGT0_9BACL|nr:MAG: heptaprenyl diphosphate synthase component 1 [Cohnella sp.]